MATSDKRLWTGWLRQGDEHAFEALVRPHMAFALDFARRMGCTADQADDVVQTCLARLAIERDNRPVQVGIRAWLGRSVSLEARMLKRAEGRRVRREQAWEPFVPDEASIDARMAAVERGIDDLTPAQREAVWLRYRHDLDYKEIAKILDVSENACRLRVHKAMGILRERLGRDAGSLIATLPLLPGRIGLDGIPLALERASRLLPTAAAATSSTLPLVAAFALTSLAAVGVWWFTSSDEDGVVESSSVVAERDAEHAPGAVRAPHLETGGARRPPAPDRGETARTGAIGRASDTRPGAGGGRAARSASESAVAVPSSSFVSAARENPRPYRRLVERARDYFDPDEPARHSGTKLQRELIAEAKKGRVWLTDPAALRWLVDQSRSFEAGFEDRRWQREVSAAPLRHPSGEMALQVGEAAFSCRLPETYPTDRHWTRDIPRPGPFPVLVSLLDALDLQGEAGGTNAFFTRRYGSSPGSALRKAWMLFSPTLKTAQLLDEAGNLPPQHFDQPLAYLWKHYHVDFDRIVLDGGPEALAIAGRRAAWLAGLVLRPQSGLHWRLADTRRAVDACNFAHVPVYVVGDEDLAQELRDAGHPQVASGPAGEALLAWLRVRKRVVPKRFQYIPRHLGQELAHWVTLDAVDWSAAARRLDVEVVDTAKEPNTIRLRAIGIERLSLFLSNEIVDLDRPVRVVLNEKVVYEGAVGEGPEEIGVRLETLTTLFEREPVRVRSSRFFGWLYPARIVGLRVEADDK